MHIHKNAHLTLLRREEMARDVVEGRLSKARVARTYGVTWKVVTRWMERSEPRNAPAWSTLLEAEDKPRGEPRPRRRMRSRHCAGSA